ncbi:MAG: helix-turn-helix transcriptional regulator [Clostridia bacterium]|nr:helix-turn-helix transcriptional regulator [Clostridia bacterium]
MKNHHPCDIIKGMNEETLRKTIAKNLAFYRKNAGLTQAELAEKINYSDKSVSKWERGEGLPDVYVLTVIGELLGVTVNDLISSDDPAAKSAKKRRSRLARIFVPALSVQLCWLVGVITYFVLILTEVNLSPMWHIFIYTAAASAVVLVVFAHLWWTKPLCCIFVSLLIWLAALCVYISVPLTGIWLIFAVAASLQTLALLWYAFLDKRKKQHTKPQ